MSTLTYEISQRIATITLRRPQTYNALTAEDYTMLSSALREIDSRNEVLVTILQATGKWFCAGTDVKLGPSDNSAVPTVRSMFIDKVATAPTDVGRALYSHRKVLVAAVNGPVMGIMAAFLGHFDFIYCMPNMWLSVPFTFLGIVAEGGSSVTFVNRMGMAKANEVLLWGKKKEAQELLECGFINKIFPAQSPESFHQTVRSHLRLELEGLDPEALLGVKRLIKQGLADKNDPDAVNLRESFEQAERFACGIPKERFEKIARRELRHKL